MNFKRPGPAPLIIAAVLEEATGAALLADPQLVGRALLGAEVTDAGIAVARVAGVALIALGVACWPGSPLVGMLAYGALVTLYLGYLGLAGMAGAMLWPAVALHGFLTALLIRELARAPKSPRH